MCIKALQQSSDSAKLSFFRRAPPHSDLMPFDLHSKSARTTLSAITEPTLGEYTLSENGIFQVNDTRRPRGAE